jgi:hypothetical protein
VIQMCRVASPLPNRDMSTNTLHQFHCAQLGAATPGPAWPIVPTGGVAFSLARVRDPHSDTIGHDRSAHESSARRWIGRPTLAEPR